MANEPERPIETLLRAAAQKRREEAGAPFELHPANRRLLQGEIARAFPKARAESDSFGTLLIRLWPRFAGALAILAVVGMGAWLFMPLGGNGRPEGYLAKNERFTEVSPAQSPASPSPSPNAAVPPPPAAEAKHQLLRVSAEDQKQPVAAAPSSHAVADEVASVTANSVAAAKSQDQDSLALARAPQLAERRETFQRKINAPAAAASPAPAGALGGSRENKYAFADSTAATALPTASSEPAHGLAAKPTDGPVAAADRLKKLASAEPDQSTARYQESLASAGANWATQALAAKDYFAKVDTGARKDASGVARGQWFVSVATDAKEKQALADKASTAQPVLASFTVEQAGRELRIVDRDGSIYRGYLQLAAPARRGRSAKAESPAAARALQTEEERFGKPVTATLGVGLLPSQNYSFRVTGTNLSLKKRVVFSGNLLTATNRALSVVAGTNVESGFSLGWVPAESARQAIQPLLPARISGQVIVGNARPVEINALPSTR